MLKRYLLLCLLSLTFLCHAAENASLYTGQAKVNSEQISEREAAMQQAFKQVLIKLSGNSQLLQQVTLPSASQATQWVEKFRYLTKPSLNPEQPPAIFLEATFDAKAVNGFMKRNNIALWDINRPITLVWMAVEENATQTIVGEYELNTTHWQQFFNDEATARGVKVLFPLLDLTDKQQVELNDVWYHVTDVLQASKQRYQADNLLSGRVFQNLQNQQWVGNWLLTLPTEQISWQQEAATPDELIKASVDRFVNELAERAEKSEMVAQVSNLTLNIDNVRNMQSYLQIMTYLKSLTALESVTPFKITPNAVSFKVKLASSMAMLQDQIATGKMLQLKESHDNVLNYQYF